MYINDNNLILLNFSMTACFATPVHTPAVYGTKVR